MDGMVAMGGDNKGSQAGRQKRWAENVTQKVKGNMEGKKTLDPHL